ncbi:MAG: putative glycosyl transferase [Subtercola sp.]|nr:putative glycosyl transferase [Subtercola sp.]
MLAHLSLLRFDLSGRGEPAAAVSYLALSFSLVIAWLVALSLSRSRDYRAVGTGLTEYGRVVNSTFAVFGLIAITACLVQFDLARSYFAIALPIGLIGLVSERWLNRRWLARARRSGKYLSKVIVLGEVDDVRYVISAINAQRGAVEYTVVGAAVPEPGDETTVTVKGHAVPIVSSIDRVAIAIAHVGADAVIVAGPVDGGNVFIQRLGWQLEDSSIQLVLAPGLTNVAGPRIRWRPVEGLPLMHVELPQYSGPKHVLKRMLDVVLSSMALLVLAPLFLFLAILIMRDSTGSAFFRQQRIGRDGTPFTILKFRTMAVDAESRRAELEHLNQAAGPLFKLANDPRVTSIGSILRRYSLDELPQFWNVLLGQMSLVGPRPPLAGEVDTYDDMVRRRLYTKPGITGMWQVNGRSDLGWEESVRLDLYYVENWSIVGDIVILLRTAKMLVHPSGAY